MHITCVSANSLICTPEILLYVLSLQNRFQTIIYFKKGNFEVMHFRKFPNFNLLHRGYNSLTVNMTLHWEALGIEGI